MFLLDTNVVSELRKSHHRTDPAFTAWAQQANLHEHSISVMSIHEIEAGILPLETSDPRQARVLRDWLDDYVLREFQHRILPVTLDVARRSAYLLFANPTESNNDSLIAATAYVHNLTIVTRNVDDFTGTGCRVLNPWQP